MKTVVLALSVIALVAVAAFVSYADPIALADPAQPVTCVNALDEWTVPLSLSDVQQDQIRSMLSGASDKIAAFRADPALTQVERDARIHEIDVETRLSIMQVLTPDQRSEAVSLFRDKLALALGLTPDQRDKVNSLFAARGAKIAQISADKSLTPDQRKAEIKDVHASVTDGLKAILTTDQLVKLGEWKSEHEISCVPAPMP